MKAILKRIPIIRGIIAKREQAEMHRQAEASIAAFCAYWDKLSDQQQWQAAGCPSASDLSWMMRDQAS